MHRHPATSAAMLFMRRRIAPIDGGALNRRGALGCRGRSIGAHCNWGPEFQRVDADSMNRETSHPRTLRMWVLLAPATLYLAWILFFPGVTAGLLFDGSVGVLLGLYICSQPAA